MNHTIYQLFRTNGKTNRYEYIGTNIENAKITFLLYYLFSSDSIRKDHTQWKLSAVNLDSNVLLNEHEYFTIDSFEMNLFQKYYPNHSYLLSSIPWEIDDITNRDSIYDDYMALLSQKHLLNQVFDLTDESSLSFDELLIIFEEVQGKLQKL